MIPPGLSLCVWVNFFPWHLLANCLTLGSPPGCHLWPYSAFGPPRSNNYVAHKMDDISPLIRFLPPYPNNHVIHTLCITPVVVINDPQGLRQHRGTRTYRDSAYRLHVLDTYRHLLILHICPLVSRSSAIYMYVGLVLCHAFGQF